MQNQGPNVVVQALNTILWALGIKAFGLGHYPTLTNNPDTTAARLQGILDFDQADLDFNRSGDLSPRQVNAIRNAPLNGWILVIFAFLVGGLPLLGFLFGVLQLGAHGLLLCPALFIAPMLLSLAFRQFGRFNKVRANEKVRSVSGRLGLRTEGSEKWDEPAPDHYVVIGIERFKVSSRRFEQFGAFEGDRLKLYFTDQTRNIMSAEVDSGDGF